MNLNKIFSVLFLFVSFNLLSNCLGEEGYDVVCHCLNECDRQAKCQKIKSDFERFFKNSELSEGKDIEYLEVVDAGKTGCVTGFLSDSSGLYRLDINTEDMSASVYILEKVNNIPTIISRKKQVDDLCIFKLR